MVLDHVNWYIPPRARVVVLGQKGSGKSTLLQIISGTRFPTSGWVERKGSICSIAGLTRLGNGSPSIRQIVHRLSHLYHVNSDEVVEFVRHFADLHRVLDIPIRSLPGIMRQRLNFALAYAVPFDFYLFDGAIGTAKGEFADRCQKAFEARSKESGMILTTSSVKVAIKFDATIGVLHDRSIHFYPSTEQAVDAFNALPPPVLETDFRGAENVDAEENHEEAF